MDRRWEFGERVQNQRDNDMGIPASTIGGHILPFSFLRSLFAEVTVTERATRISFPFAGGRGFRHGGCFSVCIRVELFCLLMVSRGFK
jgi:hypothetical protein